MRYNNPEFQELSDMEDLRDALYSRIEESSGEPRRIYLRRYKKVLKEIEEIIDSHNVASE